MTLPDQERRIVKKDDRTVILPPAGHGEMWGGYGSNVMGTLSTSGWKKRKDWNE